MTSTSTQNPSLTYNGVDGAGGGLGGAGEEVGIVAGYFLGIAGIISKSDLFL